MSIRALIVPMQPVHAGFIERLRFHWMEQVLKNEIYRKPTNKSGCELLHTVIIPQRITVAEVEKLYLMRSWRRAMRIFIFAIVLAALTAAEFGRLAPARDAQIENSWVVAQRFCPGGRC
jgi:hypothetical protein